MRPFHSADLVVGLEFKRGGHGVRAGRVVEIVGISPHATDSRRTIVKYKPVPPFAGPKASSIARNFLRDYTPVTPRKEPSPADPIDMDTATLDRVALFLEDRVCRMQANPGSAHGHTLASCHPCSGAAGTLRAVSRVIALGLEPAVVTPFAQVPASSPEG